MKSKNDQSIKEIIASNEFSELFDELSRSIIQNSEQLLGAAELGFTFKQGYTFATTIILKQKNSKVIEKVAASFEAKKVHIPELIDVAFSAFVLCAESSSNFDLNQFKEAYSSKLKKIVEGGFGYRTRCSIFEFHDVPEALISKYVRVLSGEKLAENWNPFQKYENIRPTVLRNADFEMKSKDGGGIELTFPEIYWEVDCNSVSKNARVEAAWMAGVFTSFIRLGLPRADYCHRPSLGKIEAQFGEGFLKTDRGVAFSEDGWSGLGIANHGRYKIDGKLLSAFNDKDNQEKLDLLFENKNETLAFRVSNSLGWLAKGRQTSDFSERLLHNFTALEALLSENSTASPVIETISRFASIILAKTPKDREMIFKDVKRFYGLRSSLVHRGKRTANEIDSNGVEKIAEYCVETVLELCSLEQKHAEFLADLKSATHGNPWPK